MGAELGSMKVTEQIEAMEVFSLNPFKFPRGQPYPGHNLYRYRVLASTWVYRFAGRIPQRPQQ